MNNDGRVNILDATIIQKFICEITDENGNLLIDENNPEEVRIADVNGNGRIEIRDATEIQKIAAELI